MNKENLIDLDKKQLALLDKMIKQHVPNKTVWAYGSRVTWKASEISDLDLVVFDCGSAEISDFKEALEESNLLISVDVMDWENIPDNFKKTIRKKYVTLQEKLELDGWQEVKLGDVVKLGNGKVRPKTKGEIPVYGGNGIFGYTSQSNYTGKTIIIGRVGAYCGSVYFTDEPIWISDNALSVKVKNINDVKYIFYFLKNFNLNQIAEGSSHPLITQTLLNSLDVLICENESEQKAIGEVLSSLDDKIDLLRRQNKTLEDMAQTLFRQWFVEEADEKLEEKSLDEIAEYLNGLACQKYPPENEVDKLPVLKIKELRNGISENSDYSTSKVDKKYIVKLGDVIFSWSGSLMIKIWDGQECILNQHLFKVTSRKYPKWFYYFWTKHYLEKFIGIADSKATTMGHIKRSDISGSMALIPADDVLEKIDRKIAPLFDKTLLVNEQISLLENLRDILLPKLMRGEVKINN